MFFFKKSNIYIYVYKRKRGNTIKYVQAKYEIDVYYMYHVNNRIYLHSLRRDVICT